MSAKAQFLTITAKVAVSTALLVFLLRKAGIGNIIEHLRAMDVRYFLLAVFFYLLSMYLSAQRWSLLLDNRQPLRKLLSLYLIGSFFNNFLPGSIGGDAVKAYYVYNDGAHGASGVASIIMDRFIGYAALLSIGLCAGFMNFRSLQLVGMQWVMPSVCVAFGVGSIIGTRMRIGSRFSVLSAFYDSILRFSTETGTLIKTFALSLAVQALNVFMVYSIALGIGRELPLAALFVFFPIIVTITMIPVSISGLGVRESACALLLGLIGVPVQDSILIAFLWFLATSAASLSGLIEYIRYTKQA